MVVGMSLALASPAQAVPGQTLAIVCQGFGTDPDSIPHAMVLRPGEALTVETSGCNYTSFGTSLFGTYTYVDSSGTTQVVDPPVGNGVIVRLQVGSSVTFVAPSTDRASTWQFDILLYHGSDYYGDSHRFSISVCSGGVCPAEASIPTWVQSFQRASQSQACPDGWLPSWEQWPGAGAGGYVCTRGVPAYGS
jgi:hypothetical protein